jgi:predicted PurR-regulated permease PerM
MDEDRRIERIVGLVILAILAVGCVLVLRPFFTAACFAVVLVMATWPAFLCLERALGGRPTLAALVMSLLAALALVLPPIALALSMEDNIASSVRLLRTVLENGLPPPPAWVGTIDGIGPEIEARWRALAERGSAASEELEATVLWMRQGLISAGMSVGGAALQLALAVLTSFFLYRDGDAAMRGVLAIGRRIAGEHAPRLLRVAQATINGVVYGILGTAVIQALALVVGFWIVGIPAALFLGVLAFVLALIPMGPVLIWVPATVWLFVEGATGGAVFLIVWNILTGLMIDQVLKPYLISRGSQLPLILILFGVLGGVAAFGFLGLFLGPTLLAVAYELIREWRTVEQDASGPDPTLWGTEAENLDPHQASAPSKPPLATAGSYIDSKEGTP